MDPQVRYRDADDSDLPKIKAFLRQNDLPELGVDSWFRRFVVAEDQNGSWSGIAGLEIYGKSGLLRSVAVSESQRGHGIGRQLVDLMLAKAKSQGVKTLYLLTTDAVPFFRTLGFAIVERGKVDEAVKTSVEFTQICKSATAMRRPLG